MTSSAGTVRNARAVVIRALSGTVPVIACGASPMVPAASGQPSPSVKTGSATLIGKRYVGATGTLELLCTSSGAGGPSCGGVQMAINAARPLPASD